MKRMISDKIDCFRKEMLYSVSVVPHHTNKSIFSYGSEVGKE